MVITEGNEFEGVVVNTCRSLSCDRVSRHVSLPFNLRAKVLCQCLSVVHSFYNGGRE